MKQYFELVLFSSCSKPLTAALYEYLNTRTSNSLSDYLWADQCIKISTSKNLLFKDLRVIKNRPANRMVLLCSQVSVVGTVIESGIPILRYKQGC